MQIPSPQQWFISLQHKSFPTTVVALKQQRNNFFPLNHHRLIATFPTVAVAVELAAFICWSWALSMAPRRVQQQWRLSAAKKKAAAAFHHSLGPADTVPQTCSTTQRCATRWARLQMSAQTAMVSWIFVFLCHKCTFSIISSSYFGPLFPQL